MDTVDYSDRSTEYWAFGPNTMLDSRGKITKKSPVFFYLHLFQKLSDGAGSLLRVRKEGRKEGFQLTCAGDQDYPRRPGPGGRPHPPLPTKQLLRLPGGYCGLSIAFLKSVKTTLLLMLTFFWKVP